MMDETSLYACILNLSQPWRVKSLNSDDKIGSVTVITDGQLLADKTLSGHEYGLYKSSTHPSAWHRGENRLRPVPCGETAGRSGG